jgi:Transposase
MNASHYIGFDVHKKTISFCVKTAAGQIVEEGALVAERTALRRWAAGRKRAWHGAMEATLFSAWIYDTLKPYAKQLSMGHPAKMKAVSAGKNKSDRIDARMIAGEIKGRDTYPPELLQLVCCPFISRRASGQGSRRRLRLRSCDQHRIRTSVPYRRRF